MYKKKQTTKRHQHPTKTSTVSTAIIAKLPPACRLWDLCACLCPWLCPVCVCVPRSPFVRGNQCTGTCAANGRRTSQLICKKLFPKTPENPHPLRTGRKVDNKYCANRKRPSGSKLLKKCSKPCPFRWETSPWSKVGSVTMFIFIQTIIFLFVFCLNFLSSDLCFLILVGRISMVFSQLFSLLFYPYTS